MNSKPNKYPFAKKWAAELESDGHVQISTFFLENYHRLKPYSLTHGEAMFIVHLMQHAVSKLVDEAAFQLVAAVIRKMEFAKQYVLPANPYDLALEFGLERMFLELNS